MNDDSSSVANTLAGDRATAVVTPLQITLEQSVSKRRYLRLLAEGTAIVASVLLGFAIQAWWEARQERVEEIQLLVAVRDEFSSNLAALERNRSFHRAVLATASAVLKLAGANPAELTLEQADSLIADLSWWNGSRSWQTGAVNALTAGGQLAIIEDESLRRTLANWTERVEAVRSAEDQEYDFFSSVYMPFFRTIGSLPQISDAIRARPGSPDRYDIGRLNYSRQNVDHRHIIVGREFQNMVVHQLWIQDDILTWYDSFAAASEEVMRGVEAELARRGAASARQERPMTAQRSGL